MNKTRMQANMVKNIPIEKQRLIYITVLNFINERYDPDAFLESGVDEIDPCSIQDEEIVDLSIVSGLHGKYRGNKFSDFFQIVILFINVKKGIELTITFNKDYMNDDRIPKSIAEKEFLKDVKCFMLNYEDFFIVINMFGYEFDILFQDIATDFVKVEDFKIATL